MTTNIRQVKDVESMLDYFDDKLHWNIDFDNFNNIDDITYGFTASDIGLKNEEFTMIASLRQLRPFVDKQLWGIFAIEFDSRRFEVTALRKVLSGLVPRRRNSEHAMWDKRNLLFLCLWGEKTSRTMGVAYFEDKESGLPQIKINYCNPSVEDVFQLNYFESKIAGLSWPENIEDNEAWQKQWTGAFITSYRQVIRDSQTLTSELADIAQNIKGRIINIFKVETLNGYVHLLYDKFKQKLIHDLTEDRFADMYAQTVTYGLFSARCMDTSDYFDPEKAIDQIPNTNPFLKKLMKECFSKSSSRLSFDELELNDIVELLNNTDTDTILADFNRQTGNGKEDPVVYFYEGFLNAYESEQKKRRGVYYTPLPVVNFMVQAVDDILKTEFGFVNGLASTETKTINVTRESKRKIAGMIKMVADTVEVPAIQILDPATGTGTFLRQTILQIWENFKKQHKNKSSNEVKKLWNDYVPKNLLPCLNGFEIMMAPYAVAHMKLAMVLSETGYDFSGDERVNVFLTNSLEEAGNSDMQIKLWEDPLATEAVEANLTKMNSEINVVIGNPPYSGESANKGSWIMSLMKDYKKEPGGVQQLRERNPKWINDDYVKFIRYAQTYIERAGAGIVAYITPHGFIDNPTFRGMRWKLLDSFDKIYILDLHGNSNRQEICPDGSKDENVFDIQQGVCISFLIKEVNHQQGKLGKVFHADLYGTREFKYNVLLNKVYRSMNYEEIQVDGPEYFFIQKDLQLKHIYEYGFSINELFSVNGTGVITKRDDLCIHMKSKEALQAAQDIINLRKDVFYRKYSLPDDVRDWRYEWARSDIQTSGIAEKNIQRISYRPFDERYIYYTGQSRGFVGWPVYKVMQHMLTGKNVGLATARSNKSESCDHFFISKFMMETKYGERTTQSALFPLFLFDKTLLGIERKPNLYPNIVKQVSESIELPFNPQGDGGRNDSFSPIDLFDYIYAVLYSPRYRETYKDFLKTDFPRVPYPTQKEVFWNLVKFGGYLRQLHLLESEVLDDPITCYPLLGTNVVEKILYKDECVYINEIQYFKGVPKKVWEFYICGYQPAQKWLKSRKGLLLNQDDIQHYQIMITSIFETDRIMKEIDKVFIF